MEERSRTGWCRACNDLTRPSWRVSLVLLFEASMCLSWPLLSRWWSSKPWPTTAKLQPLREKPCRCQASSRRRNVDQASMAMLPRQHTLHPFRANCKKAPEIESNWVFEASMHQGVKPFLPSASSASYKGFGYNLPVRATLFLEVLDVVHLELHREI